MTPVSLRVEELRNARGWSQAELARQSGVPQPTISRLEAGKTRTIDLDNLERLAEALGVNAAELIEHDPWAGKRCFLLRDDGSIIEIPNQDPTEPFHMRATMAMMVNPGDELPSIGATLYPRQPVPASDEHGAPTIAALYTSIQPTAEHLARVRELLARKRGRA